MLLPTDTEIAAAKADAAQRFGRDEVLLISVAPPVDFAVLVAPVGLEAYCVYCDGQVDDMDTARRNLLHARRVWPSAEAVTERLRHRPALAQRVAGKLMTRAGKGRDPDVTLLAEMVTAAATDADALPKLTRSKAAELLAADPNRELWGVVGPGLALVMATPEGDVWSMAQTRELDAMRAKKGIVRATLDFALQAVVWSAIPIDALLEDLPAISGDIAIAYKHMGGDAAEATSKSL